MDLKDKIKVKTIYSSLLKFSLQLSPQNLFFFNQTLTLNVAYKRGCLVKVTPVLLCVDRASWNLKGKVIRLWQVSDFNGNRMSFSIELVLLDEASDRIHATINKTLLCKFRNDLFEGRKML